MQFRRLLVTLLRSAAVAASAALLIACGSDARSVAETAAPPTTTKTAALPPTKSVVLVDRPIVLFRQERRPNTPGWDFRVYVRTTSPLPKDRRGVRAYITLNGTYGDTSVYTVSRQSHCYSQDIFIPARGGPGSLATPHDQQMVDVVISLFGTNNKPAAARSVPAQFQKTTIGTPLTTRADHSATTKLGCANPRF